MNGFEPMAKPDLTTWAVMEARVFWRGFMYGAVIVGGAVYGLIHVYFI